MTGTDLALIITGAATGVGTIGLAAFTAVLALRTRTLAQEANRQTEITSDLARAASRQAEIASEERQMRLRPLLLDAPPGRFGSEKVWYSDSKQVELEDSATVHCERDESRRFYLSVPLFNGGPGLAVIKRAYLTADPTITGVARGRAVASGAQTRIVFVFSDTGNTLPPTFHFETRVEYTDILGKQETATEIDVMMAIGHQGYEPVAVRVFAQDEQEPFLQYERGTTGL